jgi:hypothetical protein
LTGSCSRAFSRHNHKRDLPESAHRLSLAMAGWRQQQQEEEEEEEEEQEEPVG